MGSCNACGQSLDAFDHFCRACGHRVVEPIELEFTGDAAKTGAIANPRQQTLHVSSPEPNRRRANAQQALGLVLAMLVVGLVGFTWVRADSNVTDSNATESNAAESSATDPNDAAPGRGAATDLATARETRTDAAHFVAIAPDPVSPVDLATFSQSDLSTDIFVLIEGEDRISLINMATGAQSSWDVPEPLLAEDPVAVDGSVVVVGETSAWTRSVAASTVSATAHDEPTWRRLGPADRVRFSTKRDRVWLRSLNVKSDPTDAEFLWNEVDLSGQIHRTMFRDRELYFPTPELVAGIGGDIFRLTDADINAWRIFSPYGVIIATGHHDLVVKECDSQLQCERVWYDTTTGTERDPVYADLAQNIDTTYGARISLDGRFAYYESESGGLRVQSVVDGRAINNRCQWNHQMAWTGSSEVLACLSEDGVELHETSTNTLLGTISLRPSPQRSPSLSAEPRFVFVPTGPTPRS